jgi:hypothetical protein
MRNTCVIRETCVPHRRIVEFMLAALSVTCAAQCGAADNGDAAAAVASPAAIVSPGFSPGLDDLMTLLVAPRHVKLHYAGTRRNWELAAFEMQELRASFRRIVASLPMYLDHDVRETIDALMEAKMQATELAIAAGDAPRFGKAFAELTDACNACHAYLEHPFLVIKVPDASATSAYPAQEFRPAP